MFFLSFLSLWQWLSSLIYSRRKTIRERVLWLNSVFIKQQAKASRIIYFLGKILKWTSYGHFTIPWGHRRGVVNGNCHYRSHDNRVGYRLGFFRYRCLNGAWTDTYIYIYIYIYYIYTYTHTHTHILYMELMKLQEIPNMDKGIAIPVTE